jgi:hypothetical protein
MASIPAVFVVVLVIPLQTGSVTPSCSEDGVGRRCGQAAAQIRAQPGSTGGSVVIFRCEAPGSKRTLP